MRATSPTASGANPRANQWKVQAIVLGGALLILFIQSFDPSKVFWLPLTTVPLKRARCGKEIVCPPGLISMMRGLAWLGGPAPVAAPTLSMILLTILPPLLYLKVYAPLTLVCVGFSAWFFFRQLRFNPSVCVLEGLGRPA